MFRLTAMLKRAPGVSRSDFVSRLRQDYVPRLRAHAAFKGKLPKIVINHPLELKPADLPDVFDAELELWFHEKDAAVAALAEAGRDPALADAAGCLIDRDPSITWLAEVFPHVELGNTNIKFTAAGNVQEGCTVEWAQKYWHDVHPVVAKTVPEAFSKLNRYIQMHGRAIPDIGLGRWLGRYRDVPLCANMGFENLEKMVFMYTCPGYMAIIRPDELKFSRPGEMLAFVASAEEVLY